ncbi:hypothetical protein P154DRAFT_560302 [Amniculicola lignicola CBS 123094]|uniref:Tautomerase cis-CaaD-like domain-containing protein n=1 Tax=Amniculicola lignicola CBS 123094 TaxID=1392246 RepID=A0A6A5WVX2_9PLEO|nr:hypothetical protein P154DRAFT_560302 [Amniculicola lignicola CBS 123094]
MPLWIIYHPQGVYETTEEKQTIAKTITSMYTSVGLPAFYVNVFFMPLPPTSFFIGGVPRPSAPSPANAPGPDSSVPFIRITIQHIARTHTTKEQADRMLAGIDKVIKPWVYDKGYDSEYSVEETSRDLWKIDGLVPPMPRTEAEKVWARENRSSIYEKEGGGLL